MDISGLVSLVLHKGVREGREVLGFCFKNVW